MSRIGVRKGEGGRGGEKEKGREGGRGGRVGEGEEKGREGEEKEGRGGERMTLLIKDAPVDVCSMLCAVMRQSIAFKL